MKFRHLCIAIAGCALAAIQGVSLAQSDYPNRPVRLIIPYPAGPADSFARMLAERLAAAWKQPVIVDNKPGGNAIIGTMAGRDAAPDGYTLTFGASGPLAGNPSLFPKLPYDPLKDFTFISGLTLIPLVIVANNDAPFSNLRELVEAAKKAPGLLQYASTGTATSDHLTFELFKSRAGIEMVQVPYKGNAPALSDLLGGHIKVMVAGLAPEIPLIKAGKIKGLAVTGAQRFPQVPNVPTVAEQGFPGFEGVGWGGLIGPAGLPQEVVERAGTEVRKILRDPAFASTIMDHGFVADPRDAKEFRAFVQAEIEKWGQVIRTANIKVQ